MFLHYSSYFFCETMLDIFHGKKKMEKWTSAHEIQSSTAGEIEVAIAVFVAWRHFVCLYFC